MVTLGVPERERDGMPREGLGEEDWEADPVFVTEDAIETVRVEVAKVVVGMAVGFVLGVKSGLGVESGETSVIPRPRKMRKVEGNP